LEQRRAFNSHFLEQTSQATLVVDGKNNVPGLQDMEYRQAEVVGEYDHEHQIALRNQYWQNEWGAHLITPLHILGSQETILIDRGWIPAEDFQSGDWTQFDEPGVVKVAGVIRSPREKADYGNRSDIVPAPGEAALKAWNFVNIEGIQVQTPYHLLPAYIQQAPEPTWNSLPYRTQPEIEITEGPHMGYASQWFAFATILGLGYPFFLRRQKNRGVVKPTQTVETGLSNPETEMLEQT
jgi:surfeit locus 1 family protein